MNYITAVLTAVCVLIFSTAAHADDDVAPAAPFPRVRATSAVVQRAIDTGVARSSTFRSFVSAIGASDLIVHITPKSHGTAGPRGMLWFVVSAADVRYVRIEVDARLPTDSLIALVGHELYHACEIAAAPEVTDTASFRTHYQAISDGRCGSWPVECFDTWEAIRAGWNVSRELSRQPGTSAGRR